MFFLQRNINRMIWVLLLIAGVVLNLAIWPHGLEFQQQLFLTIFSVLAVASAWWDGFKAASRFLLTLFFTLVCWRLLVLADLQALSYLYAGCFSVTIVALFIKAKAVYQQQLVSHPGGNRAKLFAWQLTLIRIYVGFNLIPHFCEKLFAGGALRLDDINAFASMGLSEPMVWVIAAGLCELGAAISLGAGLFTRLGSACFVAYLLVASILGGHFDLGFIWAAPGGGWEYPVMWAILSLSFVIGGGGFFSMDRDIRPHLRSHPWVLWLMGGQKWSRPIVNHYR